MIFDCRVANLANCFPMIPSGKAHHEMLLGEDVPGGRDRAGDRCRRQGPGVGVDVMSKPAIDPPASAYFLEDRKDPIEAHTLSIVVDNEPGVLARVIGLFSGRGYNIELLTVSETEHETHVSRITIVTPAPRCAAADQAPSSSGWCPSIRWPT